jgi:hypothetical protein
LSSDDILLPNCVETLLKHVLENESVVFAHGQAVYFDKNNKEFIEWKYFNCKSGVYELNNEVAERLLNFSYVCFAGCLIKRGTWIEIIKELHRENLVVDSCLDILVTSMLFDKGGLYYYNSPLAKVRIENESRNTIDSMLIKDKVIIFNFWERNLSICNKIVKNLSTYFTIRKSIYEKMASRLCYEYLNKIIDLKLFRNAKKDLRSFKGPQPFKYFFTLEFINLFPRISVKLYEILKRF